MKQISLFKAGFKYCLVLGIFVFNIHLLKAQTGTVCVTSNTSGEQVTNESNTDEIYYKLWNQNNQGSSCMTLGDGFKFNCEWNGIQNSLARRGYRYDETQTHSQLGHFTLAYNCSYNPVCATGGNSYLAIYGWTYDNTKSEPNDLVEYYIIENWCNWNPSMATENKTNLGTITVNGAVYDVIKVIQYDKPSIKGNKDNFIQYFSVRQNTRNSGTIDISKHFQQWEAKGLPLGKFYEITMVVEGYKDSGTASFSKLDFGYSRGSDQENNATSVSFSQASYSIAQGTSYGLDFQRSPSNSTLSNVYIESSNPNVASVGVYKGYFFVHGENPGTATLTLMSGTTPNSTVQVTVTNSNAQQYILNAAGTQGTEEIAILVDNTPVKVLALTKNMQTYSGSVSLPGNITVEFLNDDGVTNGSDVRLDYIIVNGVKRETEAMAENSGAYGNGVCGGGSYTEWLHCNGSVNYGPAITQHTITIRARGNQGGEHMDLLINGKPVNNGWWLGTTYQEYVATVTGDGDINVEFDNDGAQRDLVVDWIRVDNQSVRQAENMQYNTGYYANGMCGGGSYSQWLHCNGVIGFGKISDNFKAAESISDSELSELVNIYPNPSEGIVNIDLCRPDMNANVRIFDFTGKVIYSVDGINEKMLKIEDMQSGIYIVSINGNGTNVNRKVFIR